MENTEKRRIFLYGNTVILGTVGASLRHFPQFSVVPISSSVKRAQEMRMLERDVVLFDLDATSPETAFCFLESCPGLLLVGLSPSSNMVRIWSGRQLRELSTQSLVNFIDEQLKDSLDFNLGNDISQRK